MFEDWIHEKLKTEIGILRYNHSIGVMETSIKLAKYYGVNEKSAALAGLLHDCAKSKDKIKLLKMADEFGIILDNVMKNNLELIHGPIGAEIAKRQYNIEDKKILSAIQYHTTGKEDMSILEKIIFIADYIEPNRKFKGVEEARKLAFEDLDESLIYAMDNTIKFVINSGGLIHLDTVKARNYLKIEKSLE
ncbi:bis(5'-nucleosyl)-tetraphosphatase (symmetrical) YqeK [Anaerosalibacter bizertensis]|uniref:bis(5'-nucleosyl)-tetraphosphatase (symmetrical) n=1 Tax=Anaerosalibacter bizertensis TaxID=932217 RepID=A0A9Q4FKZ1_9FIRM|nr:bis(5'-nucleosyl)-tetraphosphatase (symmetrical) YqeK [Anaerosalibacter bizertensis]MBV1817699.1 bis(5'-nucleosyl)-tetraphosphatase (symmetrical) YqeK [Bacteroidales bacterium MSK.15.36]HHV27508.1 HD domain-containing protein [Tissierellia bacterium]MBU5294045.1 bis(5'-nucleosyl)-tetraphosphatase (symmetrical) YqeK [Anaerosalibacter bizertensis]MCB5559991.1 bis(5'-nucleosyl)-tetraphosphatase (symmetrical) YqeK [Anaerosalibacter bizertensis]MCG4565161.1 bis(5'-nucleosyl)-tetraphosphatase (sy